MASYTDLRQIETSPADGGRIVLPVVRLLAALAATIGLAFLATASSPWLGPGAQPTFLARALGDRIADAPFRRTLGDRVRVVADGNRFSASALGQTVALASASGGSAWSTHDRGRTRATAFGSETIVQTRRGIEQYLTVERHLGTRTWSWQLETALRPEVVGKLVRFVDPKTHRVSSLTIQPAQALAADGSDVTPKGARWSVAHGRLELRIDDSRLALPYVIDPAIVFKGSGTGSNGGALTFTIPIPAVAVNDVVLIQAAVRGNGVTVPTITVSGGSGGFASIVRTTDAGNTIGQEIFRHKVTGAEAGNYTVTLSASAKAAGGAAAYAGVDTSTTNGIDQSAGAAGASSATVTAPSVTPTRTGGTVAAFFSIVGGTTLTASVTNSRWASIAATGGAPATRITAAAGDYTGPSSGTPTGAKTAAAGAAAVGIGSQVALFVDSTAPTAPAPTIAEATNDSYQSGSTFYYRPAGAGGTFTVTEGATDTQSGIKQVAFPGLTGNFTPTTVTNDTTSPYSQTYTWPAITGTDSGSKTITVTDNANGTATTSFDIVSDSSVPTPATTFPGTGSYRTATWATGCVPTPGFCGTTAVDGGSGLQKVEISIRRDSNSLYWNGASFSSAAQVFQLATGTTSWQYNFPAASLPADGTYTVTVRSTDNVSNVATASAFTFTWDTTLPAAPTSLGVSPASPANNNSPAVTGTAEAGSTATLYTNSTCTSAVAGSGTAAAFASPGLTVSVADNSSTTFYATATDAAGNVSSCSSGVAYVEDSTAPAAPSSLSVSPASPANNNSPAISGTAEAGSTVKLYTNATCTSAVAASGTAAAFASPGLPVAVADNSSTTFYATATDAAANVSLCSSGVAYVEDSSAPAAPSSLSIAPASPANNNSPAISGTAEAGSTVKLYTNATCTSAVAASGTAAAFSSPGLTAAVADNSSTSFYATATDAAGNVSSCSSGVAYVEDSTAPAAPSSLAVSPSSPANNNNPKISGTAEAGSTVKLYTNATCTSAVAASGTAAAFSAPGLTAAVADNSSTSFYATATDAAGNVSSCSSGVAYVEDSTAPAAPSSLSVSPTSPANNNSPKISGSAEAGSTVKLYTNATCTSAVAASGTAAAFSSPGLPVAVADNSSTSFYATATDAAGNVSSCSSGVAYVEDSAAPAAPSALGTSPASPANDNFPEITGSAEAGSTVNVYTNATCTSAVAATGTAAAFASPGLTVSVADNASTTFYATATDAAGNVSSCSSGVAYVEDSTAPAAPSSLSVSPASPANNNSPAISGTAEAGSTVKLYTNATCTSAVAASGTAAAFASPGLPVAVADNSSTTFYATATDAAANVSLCSSGVAYVEDSAAPTAPSGLSVSPASPANNNSPQISGTAEAGSTVKLYTNATCTSAVAASGTAAAFSSPGLTAAVADNSSTSFYATATDAAANVSACSTGLAYVEDSTAPAAPSSLAVSPSSPANNNSPKISGTAEAGSTVKLYTNATCTSALAASGTAAAFSAPGLTAAVADNSSASFYATATDAAGNVSSCSSGVAYVEDSTAPTAPSALDTTPASPSNSNNPKVSGSAEAGSTVELYTNAACTSAVAASGTAAAFSSPGLAVSVADNTTTTFYATATDLAGNASSCSAGVTYQDDAIPPAAPSGLDTSPASPSSANNPKVTGSAEAGSLVKLYTNATCTSAVAASGTAVAFSSPGLAVAVADDSSTTFYATATDAAGNVSACSSGVTYVEDSTAPAAPGSLVVSPTSPANANAPRISGGAEAGSIVNLYTNASCTSSVAATGAAATFASPGLAVSVADDSSTTFYGTATDAAGNVSPCSSGIAYVEDSTPPAAPGFLASNPVSPANANNPSFSGAAEAAATVKLYTDASCAGAPVASGTDAAFASPGLSVAVLDDTTTTFYATATDAAGNVSACSTGLTYIEDSTGPAVPTGLAFSPSSPANDNAPKLSGTAEAASTVRMYANATCAGAPAASGTAAAFASPGLGLSVGDDSSTTFYATATDAAGNVSACSSGVAYVEDSTKPASTVTFPAGGGLYRTATWNGGCSSAICGTASDGVAVQRVELSLRRGTGNYWDGSSFGSATETYVAATGTTSWSYAFPAASFPADGTYVLHARAVDTAGNVEDVSTTTVTFDATAPTGSVTAPSAPFVHGASLAVASDSADTGGSGVQQAVFEASPGGAGSWTTIGTDTSWPYSATWDTTALSDGAYDLRVRTTDGAGNSFTSGVVTVGVDNTAPSSSLAIVPGARPDLQYWNAATQTYYYNPAAGGDFTVGDSPSDVGGAGVASVQFPVLADTGFTGPARTATSAPYDSDTYSFTSANASAPSFSATVTDNAGNQTTDAPTFVRDVTPPAGMSATVTGGYVTTASVPVTLDDGTDAGAGLALSSRVLERDAAPLSGGTCDPFGGAWAPVTLTAGSDTSVQSGTCYRYRLRSSDRVGNAGVQAGTSATVKVDTTAPGAPALSFSGLSNASVTGQTVYFRAGVAGGLTVTPSSSDAESGVASYAYPSLGAGWTGTGGAYSFDASAADPGEPNDVTATNGAGMTSSATSFTVTPDATAPVTTIDCDGAPCAGWHTAATSVALAASDGGSGVDRIEYTTDGSDPTAGGGTTYAGPFTVSSSVTVRFAAYDKVGNVESVRSQSVNVDTTPPTAPTLVFSGLTSSSETGGTVFFRPGAAGGFTVTPTSGDPESGVASYGYPDLGAGWTRSGSDYSFDASAADPAEPNNLTATNGAGLTSSPSPFTVTADGQAPATAIGCDGGSCAGWRTTSPVSVSLSADDGAGSGVTQVRYTTDGSDPTLLSGQVYAGPISVAQTTEIRFRAFDAVGNVEPVSSQLVRVDPSAPSVSAAAANATGDTFWSAAASTLWYRPGGSGSFDLTAAVADAQSGDAKATFPALSGFGSGGDVLAPGPYAASYSYSGGPAEPGSVSVGGTNGAGLSASASLEVRADGSAPTGGSIAYTGGWSAGGSVTVTTADGTDAGSGLGAGAGVLERQTAPLSDGACTTWGSWSAVSSPDSLPGGVCARYRYRVSDRVGNVATYGSANVVRYDATAPPAPALSVAEFSPWEDASGTTLYYNAAGTHSGSFTVTAGVADAQSGIAQVAFPAVFGADSATVPSSPYSATYSWSAGATASGPRTVTASNGAGLPGSSDFTVTPDPSAPAGGSVDYPNGYASGPIAISTDGGMDSGSGLDPSSAQLERRTAPLGGSGCGVWTPWVPATSPDTVADGTCAVYRYRISDRVGNETIYTSANVAKADSTAPAVTETDPGANVRRTITLAADATDGGSGVDSVRFQASPTGSGTWLDVGSATAAPFTASFDTTSIADGLYDFRAVAVDGAGNSTASAPVTGRRIDNTPPTATLDDPGSLVRGTVALSSTSGDLGGSGVASVTYEVSPAGAGSWSAVPASWNTAVTGDGLYDLRVVATDAAGNTAISPERTNVRVDNTAPTVSLASPGANVSGTVPLDATADDGSGSGIASVTYEFAAAGSVVWLPTPAAWNTTLVSDGLYDLRATATDQAGNTTSSAVVAGVRVDNSPPTVSVSSPANGSYVNAASPDPLTVTAAAADTGSGVAQVELFACSDASPGCATGTWSSLGVAASTPWTASWPVPADGNRALRAVATDKAGRQASAAVDVTVDRTPPDTTIGTKPGDPSSQAAPAFEFSSTETGSSFECRTDGGGWSSCASPWAPAPLADGTHTVDVRAIDPAGNPDPTPDSWTWLVDATPPDASMGDPGRIVRGDVSLLSTSSDPGPTASGVATVVYEYSADGGTTWAATGPTWSTAAIEDGVYELHVVVTDRAGNATVSDPVTDVRVDNTPPTTSQDELPPNLRGTVTLSGAADDAAGSGVAQVTFQYSVSGANTWQSVAIVATAPYSTPLDTTTLSDGLYDFRTIAVDVAGNETDGEPVTGIRIDNTPPTVAIANPGTNLRRTVTLSSTADDAGGSGVAAVTYQYSLAGSGTWRDTSETWNTASVEDGVYDLRTVAVDVAGNTAASNGVTSRVDNTPPATTDNAPSGWQSSDVTVTLSASDAGSGPSATEYAVDGGSFQTGTSVTIPAPSDGSNDGTHTISYFSTDTAGNVEAVKSADVLIDGSPPGSRPTDPGAYLSGTVTLSASPSSRAGVKSVEFQYSSAGAGDWRSIATRTSAPWSTAWDTTSVADGAYDLRFIVTDKAVPAKVTTTTLPSKIVDNTAPTGTVGSPTQGSLVSGDVSIAVAASDATSRVASVEIRVNGSTVATLTGAPYRTTWDSTSVSDGSVTIDAVVTDLAGNSFTTGGRTITVDNSVPTPSLGDPGAVARGTISLSATSDADTEALEFQRSPAGAGDWTTIATDTSAPFGASFATVAVADGSYDLRAVATDGSGHRGASGIRTILVDNTAPTGSLTQPSSGATVGGPAVPLAASAADSGSGVGSVTFEQRPAGSGAYTAIATAGSPYQATWDTTALASGSYDLRVVVLDAAGNRYAGGAVTVAIDSTAPTVTLANPGSPLSGTVALSATAGASATRVDFESSPAGAASWSSIGSDSSAPWGVSFDTTRLADGLYDLRAVAYDSFGNSRASVRSGIRIDNTAPSLASSTPADGATVASASAISLIASESLAGVTGVTLDGAATVTPVLSGNRVDLATGSLADGPHTLRGTFRDVAGKTGPFRLDFTVSSGTVSDPPPVTGGTSSSDDTSIDSSDGGATVTVPAGAWADPGNGDWILVTIDPSPAGGALGGYTAAGLVYDVTAKWAISGVRVTRFDSPLEIVLRTTSADAVPATSEGGPWTLLRRVPGQSLPAGWDDGYFRDAAGVHLLTKHLSSFALVRDTTAPNAPTGFRGDVSGGALTLSWTPDPDGGAAGDEVICYVNGAEVARYPTSQTQAQAGGFDFADARTFELAQVDAFGNVSAHTYALRGLPALVGKTRDEAATALGDRGFTVGTVTTVPSSAPAGTVVSPSEVAVLRKGSAVDLVLSAGPGSGDTPPPPPVDGGNPQGPLLMRVAEAKQFSWALGRTLGARVQLSRAAPVVATLVQPSGVVVQSWTFPLRPGATVVKIQLPPGARRAGRYTVSWVAGTAPNTVTRTFALQVRAARATATRGTASRPVDILVTGKPSFAASVRRGLAIPSVRVAPTDLDGAFDLSASSSRDVRVIVVDVRAYGLQAIRDLRTVFPDQRILAIATDRRLKLRALKAGADNALPPAATPTEVARAAAALLSARR